MRTPAGLLLLLTVAASEKAVHHIGDIGAFELTALCVKNPHLVLPVANSCTLFIHCSSILTGKADSVTEVS